MNLRDRQILHIAFPHIFPVGDPGHPHQIRHLDDVTRHGAIAFVVVRFIAYDITYYVVASTMTDYIRTCGRSSIPYAWFQENGHRISGNSLCPVDYLKIVDKLYFKENQ